MFVLHHQGDERTVRTTEGNFMGWFKEEQNEFDPSCGSVIDRACEVIVWLANERQCEIWMNFNDTKVTAKPGSDARQLLKWWYAERDRARAEYEASPEYKEQQRKAAEHRKMVNAKLEAEKENPPTIKVNEGMEEEYQAYVTMNSNDGYSRACITFSERWGSYMEKAIEAGEKIEDCAGRCCSEADLEGITGFMYGCAVSGLSKFWIHGAELRAWHNGKYIKDEERLKEANESGGTVNPAILTLGG